MLQNTISNLKEWKFYTNLGYAHFFFSNAYFTILHTDLNLMFSCGCCKCCGSIILKFCFLHVVLCLITVHFSYRINFEIRLIVPEMTDRSIVLLVSLSPSRQMPRQHHKGRSISIFSISTLSFATHTRLTLNN